MTRLLVRTSFVTLFLTLAAGATTSFATPIVAGQALLNLTPTTLLVPAPTVPISTSTSSIFSAPALPPLHFSGVAFSTVYQESLANNPLGGLTFVYDVSNDSVSPDRLERFTVGNFGGITVDVGFNTATGPAIPAFIDRPEDDVIGITWFAPDTILPGTTSSELIIRTDAKDVAPNIIAILDGAGAEVAGIGPATGSGKTPEPASLCVLSLGGLALLGRRRKV